MSRKANRGNGGWDAFHPVGAQLAVVRWGRHWYALDRLTNATLIGTGTTRAEAEAEARARIASGDYV